MNLIHNNNNNTSTKYHLFKTKVHSEKHNSSENIRITETRNETKKNYYYYVLIIIIICQWDTPQAPQ